MSCSFVTPWSTYIQFRILCGRDIYEKHLQRL